MISQQMAGFAYRKIETLDPGHLQVEPRDLGPETQNAYVVPRTQVGTSTRDPIKWNPRSVTPKHSRGIRDFVYSSLR